MKNSNARGFSLVEVMIIVAIMGILAAIAVPQYVAHQENVEQAAQQELREDAEVVEVK